MNRFQAFFVSNRVVNVAIFLNVASIVLEEYGITHPAVIALDYATIVFFLIEMIVKQHLAGVRAYWRDGWNRLDGSLTLLSLPALLGLIFPVLYTSFSVVVTLRVARVFRVFRLAHIFPNFGAMFRNFKKAMRDSGALFLTFFIIILIFSLTGCALFKSVSPEYFGTPGSAFYSIFRLFTVEGWYDIPDSITANLHYPVLAVLVRVYFCLILFLLGIIGLSTLNSVFVDAMVSDNNDDMVRDLHRVEAKLDTLLRERGIDPAVFEQDDNQAVDDKSEDAPQQG